MSYICSQLFSLQAALLGVNSVNSLSPNTSWSKGLLLPCSLLQSQKCLRVKPRKTWQKPQVWKVTFSRKPRIKWGSLGVSGKVPVSKTERAGAIESAEPLRQAKPRYTVVWMLPHVT